MIIAMHDHKDKNWNATPLRHPDIITSNAPKPMSVGMPLGEAIFRHPSTITANPTNSAHSPNACRGFKILNDHNSTKMPARIPAIP